MNKLLSLLCATTLLVSTVGCTNGIVTALNVGAAALNSAGATITPSDKTLGQELSALGKTAGDLSTAYQGLLNAVASAKPSKSAEVEAAAKSFQSSLGVLLADAHVKSSEYVDLITIAVAVANTSIVAVLTALQPAPNASVAQAAVRVAAVPELPIVNGVKNAKDLKNAFNKAVKAKYPKAVI